MPRRPALDNFNGLAKAVVDQLEYSRTHSASVGTRYPCGQGLLIPASPCHKVSGAGLVPEYQFVFNIIKSPCPTVVVGEAVLVLLASSASSD